MIKKRIRLLSILLYVQLTLILLVILFLDVSYIIPLKITSLLTITGVYLVGDQKKNYFYVSSMLIMMLNDTLIVTDFSSYFPIISALGTIYFIFNILVIKRFLEERDILFSKLYSFPIIIGVLLMCYLIYSITDLVYPFVRGSFLFLIIFVISLLIFVILCFLIYLADRFTGNFRLFITASCCLIVNALLPMYYFVYQTKVFVVLIHLLELIGFFFFALFLVESKEKKDINAETLFL